MNEDVIRRKNIIWKILLFLVFVILLVLSFLAGFKYNQIRNDDKIDIKEEKKEEIKEVAKEPIKNSKYTFLSEDKDDIYFGYLKKEIILYAYYDKEMVTDFEGKDNYMYVLRGEVFIDGQRLSDAFLISASDKDEKTSIKLDDVYESLGELKDKSNDYVYQIVQLSYDNCALKNTLIGNNSCFGKYAYIVDNKGNVLKALKGKDENTDVIGVFASKENIEDRYYTQVDMEMPDISNYQNVKEYFIYPSNRLIDVHDNFLYYLNKDDDDVSFSEYKLEIINGQVKENKLNTYEINNDIVVAGQS